MNATFNHRPGEVTPYTHAHHHTPTPHGTTHTFVGMRVPREHARERGVDSGLECGALDAPVAPLRSGVRVACCCCCGGDTIRGGAGLCVCGGTRCVVLEQCRGDGDEQRGEEGLRQAEVQHRGAIRLTAKGAGGRELRACGRA